MSNPFDKLADWDSTPSGHVPFGNDYVAIVKEAGVKEISGTLFTYFDLHIPQFDGDKTAMFAMTQSKGSIRAIRSMFERLGLQTADRDKLYEELIGMKGWKLKVDFYQSKPDERGRVYENFRFKEVLEKNEDIPF